MSLRLPLTYDAFIECVREQVTGHVPFMRDNLHEDMFGYSTRYPGYKFQYGEHLMIRYYVRNLQALWEVTPRGRGAHRATSSKLADAWNAARFPGEWGNVQGDES